MAIFSAIVGIIKAIPILDKWFSILYSAYIQAQLNAIDDKLKAEKEEVQFLTLKLKEASNDTERKIAFRLICKHTIK